MEKNIIEEYWHVYSKTGTSTYTSATYSSKLNRDQAAQSLADSGWKVELFERTQRATGILKPDPRSVLRNANIGTLWEKRRREPNQDEPIRYVKIDQAKFLRIQVFTSPGTSFSPVLLEDISYPDRMVQVEEF